MIKNQLLRSSIEVLLQLQKELKGHVDKSVSDKLDEVIKNLLGLQKNPERIKAKDILFILGSLLDVIPAIVEIVHKFNK